MSNHHVYRYDRKAYFYMAIVLYPLVVMYSHVQSGVQES